jgi:cytochrome c oxidase accessory protein FixG
MIAKDQEPVASTGFAPNTAARVKLHPKHVTGFYRRLRNVASTVLQALLFILPWITWKGEQAVLFDVAHRKIYWFAFVIHPQETYFLQITLILGAMTLFMVTALFGRLWCGYACPQTLFTQSFIMVERLIEGDRAQRIRLQSMPWNSAKWRKKLLKWGVWTAMGIWLGITFAGYYVPIRTVFQGSNWGVVAFFTAVSLFDFGYFREQFCNYLCPYARFQGALMDANSITVNYDSKRGEPRGKASAPDRGSCVDCSMCVQVCPTGIDIRKGMQLECINCSACVDACDSIMLKVNQPTGLIRLASMEELQGRKTKLIRPRTVIYMIIWTLLVGLYLTLAYKRNDLLIDIVRQQGAKQTFNTTPDGRLSNAYNVELMNLTRTGYSVNLKVEDFPGAELVTPTNPVFLEAGGVVNVPVIVLHSDKDLKPVNHFRILGVAVPAPDSNGKISSTKESIATRKGVFLASGQ